MELRKYSRHELSSFRTPWDAHIKKKTFSTDTEIFKELYRIARCRQEDFCQKYNTVQCGQGWRTLSEFEDILLECNYCPERHINNLDVVYENLMKYAVDNKYTNDFEFVVVFNCTFYKDDVPRSTHFFTTDQLEKYVHHTPVFVVRGHRVEEYNKKKFGPRRYGLNSFPLIWYIDHNGRVYKGFKDYVENNTLPQCIMVIPNHDDSHRWIQNLDSYHIGNFQVNVLESPRCKTTEKLLNSIDQICNAIAIANVGVAAAALKTSIAPDIALASAVGLNLCSVWTILRLSQRLNDRRQHDESITDKRSLQDWIGIAGNTFGLGITAGNILLARSLQTSGTVTTFASLTYNTLLIGSVMINGIGMGFKGYDIISRYVNTNNVSYWDLAKDVLPFSIHFFWFCKSVSNVKLAEYYIKEQMIKDEGAVDTQSQINDKNQSLVNDKDQSQVNVEGISQTLKSRESQIKHLMETPHGTRKNINVNVDPETLATVLKNVRTDAADSVSSQKPSTTVSSNQTDNNPPATYGYNNFYNSYVVGSVTVTKDFSIKQFNNLRNITKIFQNAEKSSSSDFKNKMDKTPPLTYDFNKLYNTYIAQSVKIVKDFSTNQFNNLKDTIKVPENLKNPSAKLTDQLLNYEYRKLYDTYAVDSAKVLKDFSVNQIQNVRSMLPDREKVNNSMGFLETLIIAVFRMITSILKAIAMCLLSMFN